MLTGLFSACQHDEVYFEYNEIAAASWKQHEVLAFELDSSLIQVGQAYDVTIEVSNNVSYPYQNIWLSIDTNIDSVSNFVREEKEFALTTKQGKWLGAGVASVFASTFSFREKVLFTEKRNYKMFIRQGMTDISLPGIERVGVRVSKCKTR